ncbi:sn-glycerol-1-phosphate dehydrogenase [Fictibacillus fluitans]|uniref:Sn-glycerol-1-phosphate dehydrogenase n=1 Tax=Fictibacillus fluitans TaxID=3058422 RepID=A0ABT8HTT3_9BACL|nr:sn-glycerol-1-phosphate dehydrogenase [Fictibacillus sp. NE201]MDN4524134.1 sn-glycerol-1-phosphate dehydrogenase [Fictibacillus sp. NE201]
MRSFIESVTSAFQSCTCPSLHHEINMKEILISDEAVYGRMSAFIKEQGFEKTVLVCDENTLKSAGSKVKEILESSGISVSLSLVLPNHHGDAAADEKSLVQVLLETPKDTDVLVAVGSGTLHDIVRFASHQRRIPFISFPTAASVDGFTSAGAPLIVRGEKKTIQCTAPVALFADINVLKEAPPALAAAGFGDMLGKITSLADWKVSRWMANEPYCPTGAALTKEALENCLSHLEDVAAQSEKGLTVLLESLIISGLVMLVLDHSRPASGGEHHLSHYWEMDLLKRDAPQLLHGAKVGVASALLTSIYKRLIEEMKSGQELPDPEKNRKFKLHQQEMAQNYGELPKEKQMQEWLVKVGGPATIEELGITEELLEEALQHAHTIRDRWTGLKMKNQLRLTPQQ